MLEPKHRELVHKQQEEFHKKQENMLNTTNRNGGN